MKEAFIGTGVALITPFTEDLKPDFPALERLVNHVVEGGVEYLGVNFGVEFMLVGHRRVGDP